MVSWLSSEFYCCLSTGSGRVRSPSEEGSCALVGKKLQKIVYYPKTEAGPLENDISPRIILNEKSLTLYVFSMRCIICSLFDLSLPRSEHQFSLTSATHLIKELENLVLHQLSILKLITCQILNISFLGMILKEEVVH